MFGKSSEATVLEGAWLGDRDRVSKVLHTKVELIRTIATKSVCRRYPHFEEGDTALHLSARAGHTTMVEFLLSLKAPINAVNLAGRTPLHDSAKEGHENIGDVLIEDGADLELADAKGWTALHWAVSEGHEDVVDLLISCNARWAAQDHDGNSPLHLAARANSEAMVRLLVATGAQVNDRNTKDRSPLHMAIIGADHSAISHVNPQLKDQRESAARTVKLLLQLGADANALDSLGESPLDLLSYLEGDQQKDPLIDLLRGSGGEWVRFRHRHLSQATYAGEAVEQTGEQPPPAGQSPVAVAEPTEDEPEHAFHDADVIILGHTPIVIGRHPVCNVRYRSLTLSRMHSRIEHTDGGYVIKDLGSHNGTQIDGVRIEEPHVLRAGDLISLGAYDFEFDGARLIPSHGELDEDQLAREHTRR